MKALVLFSGGIDSTTALGLAIQKPFRFPTDKNMIKKLKLQ